MKQKLLLFIFVFMFSSCENEGINVNDFLLTYGHHIIPVQELPYSEEWFMTNTKGEYVHGDLGIAVEQVRLFTIPIWNYSEPFYIMYEGEGSWKQDKHHSNFRRRHYTKEMEYYKMTDDDMDSICRIFPNVSFQPKLSFWQRIGGKMCFIGLLVLYLLYEIISSNKDKKEENV